MKNLLLVVLLLAGKARAQSDLSIRQIDSLATAIEKMQLAVKGGAQELGTMKNATWFYYDSTTRELRKVVQTISIDSSKMEMVFYYSGKQFRKFRFIMAVPGGGSDAGAVYYAGKKVLRDDSKGTIDTERNQWRGQGFVALFAELLQEGLSQEALQKRLFLSGFSQ